MVLSSPNTIKVKSKLWVLIWVTSFSHIWFTSFKSNPSYKFFSESKLVKSKLQDWFESDIQALYSELQALIKSKLWVLFKSELQALVKFDLYTSNQIQVMSFFLYLSLSNPSYRLYLNLSYGFGQVHIKSFSQI